MAKFNTLVEYQRIDMQIQKLLKDIDNSDPAKRRDLAREGFNKAKQSVEDNQALAGSILTHLGDVQKSIDTMIRSLTELESQIDVENDANQQTILLNEIENIRFKLIDAERQISDRRIQGEKILKEYNEATIRGSKMRSIFEESKIQLADIKAKYDVNIAELKVKLDLAAKEVEPSLLAVYNENVGKINYPIFVPLNGESCGGCGLSVTDKQYNERLSKGYFRCENENCKRLIFCEENKK